MTAQIDEGGAHPGPHRTDTVGQSGRAPWVVTVSKANGPQTILSCWRRHFQNVLLYNQRRL